MLAAVIVCVLAVMGRRHVGSEKMLLGREEPKGKEEKEEEEDKEEEEEEEEKEGQVIWAFCCNTRCCVERAKDSALVNRTIASDILSHA